MIERHAVSHATAAIVTDDGELLESEVSHDRLATLEGVLEVGQEIDVKLLDIDKKTGKYRLSRKVLLPKPERAAGSNGEAQA